MDAVIDKYQSFVRSIIRQKTGAVNQDLEQEVFFRIWQKRGKYIEQGKEKSWVGVVTYNACIDYFKSKFFNQSKKNVEISQYICDEMQNPEQKLSDAERSKIILRAVNGLPRKLKQVVILHEFEQESLEQIAVNLDIPLGTVKSRLFNAKKILVEKLKNLKPK